MRVKIFMCLSECLELNSRRLVYLHVIYIWKMYLILSRRITDGALLHVEHRSLSHQDTRQESNDSSPCMSFTIHKICNTHCYYCNLWDVTRSLDSSSSGDGDACSLFSVQMLCLCMMILFMYILSSWWEDEDDSMGLPSDFLLRNTYTSHLSLQDFTWLLQYNGVSM